MLNSISVLVIAYPLWLWGLVLALALWWAVRRDLPWIAPAVPRPEALPGGWDLPSIAVGITVLGLATALTAYTLWRPEFAARDSFVFTTATLLGDRFPPPVWPPDGRFWPLGLQEFNAVRHLTDSAFGYHLVPALQLLAVLAGLWMVTRGMPTIARTAVLAALLVSPGFATSFTGLVFPERNVAFFLVVMLLLVQHRDRAPSRAALAGILASAHSALYYKETIFVLLIGFAVARLLVRGPGWRGVLAWRGREVEWGLLGVSGAWMATFLAFRLRAADTSYATRFELPVMQVLTSYAADNPILVLFPGVVAWRALRIAAGRVTADAFWDPLAAGGALFLVAYVALKLYRPYYMAPVEVIGALYLAHLASRRIAEPSLSRRRGIAAAAVLLLIVPARTTAAGLAERRATVSSRTQLAAWLRDAAGGGATGLNLFLPFTSSFDLMELAAYLRYKGLPVEQPTEDAGASAVRLLAPQAFPGGRCAPWWQLRCYEASAPPSGALLVVLPEDSITAGALAAATAGMEPMLVTEPPGWAATAGGEQADRRRVRVYRVP